MTNNQGASMTHRDTKKSECPGCGAEIQFEHPGKPGFIPYEVYEKRLKEGKEIICQRCFKLKNYGMFTSEADEDQIMDFLMKVLKKFKNVMYVFDVFDFEGTFRPEIIELLEKNNVIFVANKFDTLPKTVGANQLKQWLIKRINVPNAQIYITSTKNGFGISKLKKDLERLTGSILVLGVTNVGKSSILKSITESSVTVSPYPGTTIGLVEHKIGKLKIFDAPGIVVGDRMIELFDPECQSKILAKGEVTRKTFKPYPEEMIFIGGLCKLNAVYVPDETLRPIFQIYAPENVAFHKTKNENFINNYSKYFGKVLVPPCGKFDISILNFKEEEIVVDENQELSVSGFCWINVKRGPVKFKLTLPQDVNVYVREALMQPKRKFNKI